MDLINAIKSRNEILAFELLVKPNIDCNYVNSYGETALIWACRKNMETVALKLLEKPDIDYNHVNAAFTPLKI